MTQTQIQELFTQPYNQVKYKQFLGESFANTRLLSIPEILKNIDNNIALNVQKLGYIILDENGIDRNIGIYDVTLAQGVILERNRVGLRNLLRKYWQNIDGAFIVYHCPENTNWRFTYGSELTGYDGEGEFIYIKTEPKRYTYLLGEGERVKTAIERFETIIKKGNKVSLDDIKEAFSVEKLSKIFFDQYKKQYDIFCKYMVSQPGILQTIFKGDQKAIRDFNKKLLGRIVFLYFIQKKGWLGVPKNQDWGQGDQHFLTNQFNNFKNKELFYQDFLAVLFFDTLNTKRKDDLIYLVKNNPWRIPYLNGGLFEEDDKIQRNLIFPSHLFENLFNFFNQYNFTIYEDDPNDHTVAVDPEMLGHIFENLLEDNKDKGAYYTPKEIVHYMGQESLIEYLITYCLNHDFCDLFDSFDLGISLTEENQRQLITQFIKNKEIDLTIFNQSQQLYKSWLRHLNNALDKVKICDPAIGSGAFPMGLLQEIFTAKQTLFMLEYGNTNNFNASEVKLNIIQNSIYGVDIEKGAVDIARLRFWLSLIVEENEPKALPNLDYKIVVGNSLVSKLGEDIIEIDWEMKGHKQTNLLYDVSKSETILAEISDKQNVGFDIVIGNPPYVNIEKIDQSIKDNISKFKTAYQKYDLYVLFYEVALNLLKEKGILSFITSNKFLSQGYGLKLRKEFLKHRIDQIINFNYDIFESATVRTCIILIAKTTPSLNHNIQVIDVNKIKDKEKFTNRIFVNVPQKTFDETEENNFRINLTKEKITLLKKIKNQTLPLYDICSINYGLRPSSEKLGLKKEAFIYKTQTKSTFKTYFEGKDMGYWLVNSISYLDYRPDLMYNAMFPELFENEKLVGLRTLSDITKLRFIYDNKEHYCNDSVVVVTLWHKFKNVDYSTVKRIITKEKIVISKKYSYQFLQGILNSRMIKFYVRELMYDGTHFYPNQMKVLPIKITEISTQKLLENIVDKIHSLKGQNKEANTTILEKKIDNLVYKLYELSYEEVKIIDPEFSLSEREYEEIKLA